MITITHVNGYAYSAIGLFFIFFMTSLGSAFVFFLKKDMSNDFKRISFGFASGVMVAASIFSLLLPALEDQTNSSWLDPKFNWLIVSASFILGCLFLYLMDKILPHIHKELDEEEGIKTDKVKRSTKLFIAVTMHNIPEGLSVGLAFGAAFASEDIYSPLFLSAFMLAVGIGIQNLPEGVAVSLPMKDEGYTKTKSFFFGVFSGLVEPIAGVLGVVLASQLSFILPFALSFAAGCMIYVVVEELLPAASFDSKNHYATWSFIVGFILMMILDTAL